MLCLPLDVFDQKTDVSRIRLVGKVEKISDNRDEPESKVESCIRYHPQHGPLAGPGTMRLVNQIGGQRARYRIAYSRNQPDQAIQPNSPPQHGKPKSGIQQVPKAPEAIDPALMTVWFRQGMLHSKDQDAKDRNNYNRQQNDAAFQSL